MVSGNGASQPTTYEPQLTAVELEQVKQDTADFNAWLDQPDDPEVLARLPLLDLGDFADDPFSMNQESETADGVTYYFNEDAGSEAPSFSTSRWRSKTRTPRCGACCASFWETAWKPQGFRCTSA